MRLKTAALLLLASTANGAAEAPGVADRFYQAIRQDDLATVRSLVQAQGANVADAQGQTPLMIASAFGSREMVRLILDSRPEIGATSTGGLTALHLAVSDTLKTQWLLDAGAPVDPVSQLGRTPLIVAASRQGSGEVVRALVARGANVNAADRVGITPLIAASIVNDSDVVTFLMDRGAEVNAIARGEAAGTPLMGAATNGNDVLVRALLERGAKVNATTTDAAATVKNGAIQFGRVTALHFAALSGNPEVVRRLLAAGAAVDAQDIRGMTALMMAIATDRPDLRVIRLLLQAGASPTLQSKTGETALDWARKFRQPQVLTALHIPRESRPSIVSTNGAQPQTLTPRGAFERSLPLLQTASARVMTDGGCVACHAQPLTGLALNLAQARGWTSASESTPALTTISANLPGLMQFREGGGLPDGLVYATLRLASEHAAPSRATDALLHYLAAKQRAEGNWEGVGGSRAPMQDGNFSRTALSIRALTTFATPGRAQEYEARVARAATWLAAQTPMSTEDRVMQLLGLHWVDGAAPAATKATRQLLSLQRADGGWAQTPYLESDAYATGQVLYALRELGLPPTDPVLRRGAAFLLHTQLADGSWHVKSRAMKIQPYFESGFPHGHDQWISHAGTAWAIIALTTTDDGANVIASR